MLEVKVLEFGYSIEKEKHFIKFNISGLEEEKKDKIIPMIVNIPLGGIKRFEVESEGDDLRILEFFPQEEYPFNKEIPDEEDLKTVEETVKGFMM